MREAVWQRRGDLWASGALDPGKLRQSAQEIIKAGTAQEMGAGLGMKTLKAAWLEKMVATHSDPEGDFGRKFLRLKGSIPRSRKRKVHRNA